MKIFDTERCTGVVLGFDTNLLDSARGNSWIEGPPFIQFFLYLDRLAVNLGS